MINTTYMLHRIWLTGAFCQTFSHSKLYKYSWEPNTSNSWKPFTNIFGDCYNTDTNLGYIKKAQIIKTCRKGGWSSACAGVCAEFGKNCHVPIRLNLCAIDVRPTLGGNGHDSICHWNPLYLRLVSGSCFHISSNLTKSKWLTRANFSERASFVSVCVLVTEQLTAFFAIIF